MSTFEKCKNRNSKDHGVHDQYQALMVHLKKNPIKLSALIDKKKVRVKSQRHPYCYINDPSSLVAKQQQKQISR